MGWAIVGLAPSKAGPSLGIHPWGFSPPLLKPLGDWFINHGIFMETSSQRLRGGSKTTLGHSCGIPGVSVHHLLFLAPLLPFLGVVPKALPAAPKGAGDPRGGPILPLSASSRGRLQLLSLLKVNPVNCRELFWR